MTKCPIIPSQEFNGSLSSPATATMTDKRIVFFAPMCLLDNTSGAALSARTYLEVLARAGFSCSSFTAALFDPNREMDRGGVLGAVSKKPEALGKRLIIEREGVSHSVFLTQYSQSKNMLPKEQRMFEAAWIKWLEQNRPNIVMTFGGSPYTTKLQGHARNRGIQIVHYLGNAEYQSDKFYHPKDIVICPSRFLRDHYKQSLGLEMHVLRNIIQYNRLDTETIKSDNSIMARKNTGFVTYMNPIPHKGLTLFFALAKLAEKNKPRLKFLVTEGRTNREWLAKRGYDLSTMKNVWFMSNHEDVRSIFERTSVLLIPSFWKEGLGRSIIEAQLSGIPVMGTTRGGIPEAMNGGGILFDAPPSCTEDYMKKPDDLYIEAWWNSLSQLLENDDMYLKASHRALLASNEFHPDTTSSKAIEFFSALLEEPGKSR